MREEVKADDILCACAPTAVNVHRHENYFRLSCIYLSI